MQNLEYGLHVVVMFGFLYKLCFIFYLLNIHKNVCRNLFHAKPNVFGEASMNP